MHFCCIGDSPCHIADGECSLSTGVDLVMYVPLHMSAGTFPKRLSYAGKPNPG